MGESTSKYTVLANSVTHIHTCDGVCSKARGFLLFPVCAVESVAAQALRKDLMRRRRARVERQRQQTTDDEWHSDHSDGSDGGTGGQPDKVHTLVVQNVIVYLWNILSSVILVLVILPKSASEVGKCGLFFGLSGRIDQCEYAPISPSAECRRSFKCVMWVNTLECNEIHHGALTGLSVYACSSGTRAVILTVAPKG